MYSDVPVKQRNPEHEDEIDYEAMSIFKKMRRGRFLSPTQGKEPKLKHRTANDEKQVYETRNFQVTQETRENKTRYVLRSPPTLDNAHKMMWQLAQNGHSNGRVRGSQDFRQRAWLYGSFYGVKVDGYKPSKDDQRMLAYLQEHTPMIIVDAPKIDTQESTPEKSNRPVETVKKASNRGPKKGKKPRSKPQEQAPKEPEQGPVHPPMATTSAPNPTKAPTPVPTQTTEDGPNKEMMHKLLDIMNSHSEPGLKRFLGQVFHHKKQIPENREAISNSAKPDFKGEHLNPVRTVLHFLCTEYQMAMGAVNDYKIRRKISPTPPGKNTQNASREVL